MLCGVIVLFLRQHAMQYQAPDLRAGQPPDRGVLLLPLSAKQFHNRIVVWQCPIVPGSPEVGSFSV